ncbi:MAG TPA: cupredoxin domain-containing protein, partial [Acidimicrobiales bacterium]
MACTSSTHASTGGGTSPGDRPGIEVTLTDGGCRPDLLQAAPGTVVVSVVNGRTDPSSFQVLSGDHLIGTVGQVPAGASATLLLDLPSGTYRTTCVGTTSAAGGRLVIGDGPGTAALGQAPDLLAAAAAYRAYLIAETDHLVGDSANL